MSTNPFDDDYSRGGSAVSGSASMMGRASSAATRGYRSTKLTPSLANATSAAGVNNNNEPAIWAARTVEWPLPSSISLSNYQKLLSKQSTGNANAVGSMHEGEDDAASASYFSGLMRSMMSPTATANSSNNSSSSSNNLNSKNDDVERSRPLRPPRCVATSNGWIVAALDCPGTIPLLRLVSRWNVRRPSSEHILALPPPIKGTSNEMARISHVFCDPTGCHTLLSAKNGEAYYLHSSSKQIQPLMGFGPETTPPNGLTGITATSQKQIAGGGTPTSAPQVPIQLGLTPGSYVTAVAWDRERGTEGSTKSILLGTNLGELYEFCLTRPGGDAGGGDEASTADGKAKLPILLHKVHASQSMMEQEIAAVSGLYLERTTSGGIVILIATSGRHKRTRLFSFYRNPATTFVQVLRKQPFLNELPGSIDFADLYLCNDFFALRTATGAYHGRLDRGNTAPSTGILVEAGMLPYGDDPHQLQTPPPVSMALTPHHLITLSESNQVRFINRVSLKVIQEEKVDWITSGNSSKDLDETALSTGELLMDIRRPDQIWLRKARTLVHISSSCEDRDVWKFTLQKALERKPSPSSSAASSSRHSVSSRVHVSGMSADFEKTEEAMFEYAKSLCSTTVQKAVVTSARAEYYLKQGRPDLAAKYWAQSAPALAPFPDTALRLALPTLGIATADEQPKSSSGPPNNMALITYLNDKMRVSKLNDDSVICTMIGAWLAELYLHERERGQQQHHSATPLNPFLSVNVDNMDAKTIMRILSSHNVSAEECAAYAAASGNVGTAVHAALSVGDPMSGAHDALRLLNEAPFETAETYYYLHASTLLSRAPLASSKSFLSRYSRGLSPTKLLPSYMHYEQQRAEWKKRSNSKNGSAKETASSRQSFTVEGEAHSLAESGGVEIRMERHNVAGGGSFVDDETASITYLEGVIKMGCRDSAIFSYLISLYVAMEDEEPLWKFLSTHVPAASAVTDASKKSISTSSEDMLSSPLDMSYTLRTILSTGRHFRSAIRVYMGFGMRQQAVELALKVDPTLARDMARESTDPEEQKRLWLMIARNAAGDSRGSRDVVAKVVAVLKDCGPDILSIEDVLPFLPDFCQIDEIKDEICEALTSYSSKIESFLKEMNECDQTCATLRDEIGRLTTHRMQMKADARCALTNKLVLNAAEPFYVFPSGFVFLASALKKEVMPYLNDKQHRRVEELEQLLSSSTLSSSKSIASMQAELDGLIAAECPLTGSIMVDSIDCGFPDSLEVGQAGATSPRDRGDSVSVITSSTGHGEFVGVRMG